MEVADLMAKAAALPPPRPSVVPTTSSLWADVVAVALRPMAVDVAPLGAGIVALGERLLASPALAVQIPPFRFPFANLAGLAPEEDDACPSS